MSEQAYYRAMEEDALRASRSRLDEFLHHLNCACTDGSCIFRPSDATGMVTNGGCKCAGDYNKRHQLERLVWWLKREVLR